MIQNLRNILELVYFACAPLILIVALIGLWQLKITKDVSRLKAKRESLLLAATQCDQYQSHTIPMINELDKAIKNNGITFFEKTEIDTKNDYVRLRSKLSKEELQSEIKKMLLIAKEFTKSVNAIESYAVFFISGMADEKTAFSSIGMTYCHSVREYLKYILFLSQQDSFQNMIKLFLLWNSRFEHQELLKKKEQINDQLNHVSNKFIKPLGTD